MKILTFLILVFLIFFISGCNTSVKRKTIESNYKEYSIESSRNLFIVSPQIKYLSINNEPLPTADNKKVLELKNWITGIVRDQLKSIGAKNVSSVTINKLETYTNRFVRTSLKENDAAILKSSCDSSEDHLYVFLYYKVRLGDDNEWEIRGLPPIAFQLATKVPQSNSYFRANIRDCSGNSLWRNEFFVRYKPEIGNSDQESKIKNLFNNLFLIEDM